MNRYLILAVVLLFSFIFSGTNCIKDEDDETCNDTKKEEINRSFNFTINVYYSDNVPYDDRIDYRIYKTYCGGVSVGEYTSVGYCDETGYWNPAYQMTYKLANEYDVVSVSFRVETSGKVGLEWHDYNYNSVAQHHFGVQDHFTLILPLSSAADTLK
jgi:hypothetical protein